MMLHFSVYAHQQKSQRNKRNNFGCSFAEAEKSASNFSMRRESGADVRACRFVYGNPSPSDKTKNLSKKLHQKCACDTALSLLNQPLQSRVTQILRITFSIIPEDCTVITHVV
ncbi:UNVERIFIED_CONTAM: hypothetical protein NCL1_25409 [Trichonephila clavipes]